MKRFEFELSDRDSERLEYIINTGHANDRGLYLQINQGMTHVREPVEFKYHGCVKFKLKACSCEGSEGYIEIAHESGHDLIPISDLEALIKEKKELDGWAEYHEQEKKDRDE